MDQAKSCALIFFIFIPLIQPHMFNFSTNLKISPGFDWFSPPLPTQFGSSSQVVTTATYLLVCFCLDIFISVDYSALTIISKTGDDPVLCSCSWG